MTPRALITGVSGFTGRHLAALLLAEGWDVAGIVGQRSCDIPGVLEHRVAIDDAGALSDVLARWRPRHVFHLAAIVDTITTPDVVTLYRANALGTAAVLGAIEAVGGVSRALVASSAFAYGTGPRDGARVREDDALQPQTHYGASKVATEVIATQWATQWAKRSGTQVVIPRAFQQTGPGHVGAYALADWASQLAHGTDEIRVGNLDVARDYLDVRDVARAYRDLMLEGRPGTVYNVASGVPVTMRALLDGLIAAFGSRAGVMVDRARLRAVDQPTFVADISRLRTDTAWQPQYSLDQTLADLAQWWRTRVEREGTVPAR